MDHQSKCIPGSGIMSSQDLEFNIDADYDLPSVVVTPSTLHRQGWEPGLWGEGSLERRNRLVGAKLERERLHLRPLPPAPIPEYVNYRVRLRKWSTISVCNRRYSVPSRLIGMEVEVRLYADHLEIYYKGQPVERIERIHGRGEARIDYRHIIGSLVRKPGALARYRYREQMFPTRSYRLAYDALRRWRGERADVEYVRILYLAATTMESDVDSVLRRLLGSGVSFNYGIVRRLSFPAPPPVPDLKLRGTVDLRVYDHLLVGGVR